jgi:hypothetical protein
MAAVMRVTAEVVAVDEADRHITLLGPRGDVVEIEVGEEVRNFDQIGVGDQVQATFLESVALYLGEPGSLPQAAGASVAARAEKGDRPAGVLVGAYDVSASVVAIDRRRREVSLVLANGTTTTVDVDPSVDAFDRLRIGDAVHARLTRAIAISVQPSD